MGLKTSLKPEYRADLLYTKCSLIRTQTTSKPTQVLTYRLPDTTFLLVVQGNITAQVRTTPARTT